MSRVSAVGVRVVSSLLEALLMRVPNARSSVLSLWRPAAVAAVAVALLACDGRTPTAADVRALDARQAERGAALLLGEGDGPATYFVDGVAATREAAQAIAPDQIAAVNVNKMMNGATATTEIRLITKAGAARGIRLE